NSGTARSGCQSTEVWQLPQAILSDPCGLRTGPRCMFCCARPPMSAVVNKVNSNRRLMFERRSMAAHAVFRGWLVEHHHPTVDFLLRAVTILAGDLLMSAVQRATGPLVIEFAGFPSNVVVTGITRRALRHGGELAGVSVLVTSDAGERRPLEHDFVGADGKR